MRKLGYTGNGSISTYPKIQIKFSNGLGLPKNATSVGVEPRTLFLHNIATLLGIKVTGKIIVKMIDPTLSFFHFGFNFLEFGLLIEENMLLRNAFHDTERLYETAGIKTNNNVHCLVRRNLIVDTYHGAGIWLDWDNRNSRCCQNIIVTFRTIHGGPKLVSRVCGRRGRPCR